MRDNIVSAAGRNNLRDITACEEISNNPVKNCIQGQLKVLNDTDEIVERLYQKLNWVLSSSHPQESMKDAPRPPSQSELVGCVEQTTGRIVSINERLKELLSRLTV